MGYGVTSSSESSPVSLTDLACLRTLALSISILCSSSNLLCLTFSSLVNSFYQQSPLTISYHSSWIRKTVYPFQIVYGDQHLTAIISMFFLNLLETVLLSQNPSQEHPMITWDFYYVIHPVMQLFNFFCHFMMLQSWNSCFLINLIY